MNMVIDYKQCTIIWHVDDLKTSHVEPAVVSSLLSDIDAEYGDISKMTITWGKLHKYLGTTIAYSSPSKVILPMVDYIYTWWYSRRHEGKIIHNWFTQTLWYCRKYKQALPDQRIYFSTFCSKNTIHFKEGTPRNPYISIITVQYIDRA